MATGDTRRLALYVDAADANFLRMMSLPSQISKHKTRQTWELRTLTWQTSWSNSNSVFTSLTCPALRRTTTCESSANTEKLTEKEVSKVTSTYYNSRTPFHKQYVDHQESILDADVWESAYNFLLTPHHGVEKTHVWHTRAHVEQTFGCGEGATEAFHACQARRCKTTRWCFPISTQGYEQSLLWFSHWIPANWCLWTSRCWNAQASAQITDELITTQDEFELLPTVMMLKYLDQCSMQHQRVGDVQKR